MAARCAFIQKVGAISAGTPVRWPLSTSAFLTHSESVHGAHPIFSEIEVPAAQRDG